MTRVLVTGSTGFVGRELCSTLAAWGFTVRGAVRVGGSAPAACAETVVVGDVGGTTTWSAALADVNFVVHLAAKAHTKPRPSECPEYVEVNANGTRALAAAAGSAGVQRFVYLSSVKVNGASSDSERPFRAEDIIHPDGLYGESKWLGERYLLEVAARSRMEAAIVRPPLVYGPGVRANFLALLRWVDSGWPLPFGGVRNRRSLVAVWNLTDLVATMLSHSRSAHGVWMVSDGDDLSTPGLVELIAAAMNRRARLVRVPARALRFLATVAGRRAAADRLLSSLTVDISDTSKALGWKPRVSVEEAISRTVSAYLKAKRL